MLSGELFVRLIVFCSKLQFFLILHDKLLQSRYYFAIAYHEKLQKLFIYKVKRVKNVHYGLWKSKTIYLMNKLPGKIHAARYSVNNHSVMTEIKQRMNEYLEY